MSPWYPGIYPWVITKERETERERGEREREREMP